MPEYQIEGLRCPCFMLPLWKETENIGYCIVKVLDSERYLNDIIPLCRGYCNECDIKNNPNARKVIELQLGILKEYISKSE